MPKMRIGVFLGCHPVGGGVYQYCISILDALKALSAERDWQVVVVHDARGWEQRLAGYPFQAIAAPRYKMSRRLYRTFESLRLPIEPLRFAFRYVHPLIKTFHRLGCERWIFPSQDIWPSLLSGVFSIATIHDLMHRYERSFPEVGARREFQAREYRYRNMCRYARRILTDSRLGRQQVMDCYGAHLHDKLWPLPFTLPEYFKRCCGDLSVLKKRAIDADNFLFYPAQFWPHKNHSNLLLAFRELKAVHPDLHLVLVGAKRNAWRHVRALIAELALEDRVHLLGYVDDEEMVGLYKLAKALVMPTFFGPTNIPPLEAAWFSCPVVYSNIYAFAEMNVENMIGIDPASVADICRGIDLALKGQAQTRPASPRGLDFAATLEEILQQD